MHCIVSRRDSHIMMIKLIFLSVALVLLYTRVSECQEACPAIACAAIEYPPSCRVTVFSVEKGQVCQLCDDCIQKSNVKDENGCPLRACNMMHIPPACKRRRYFTFSGRICEDCPQNTCTY